MERKWRTTITATGRRSLVTRRRAGEKEKSLSDYYEHELGPEQVPMRSFFERADNAIGWWLFEDIHNLSLRKAVQLVCFPILMLRVVLLPVQSIWEVVTQGRLSYKFENVRPKVLRRAVQGLYMPFVLLKLGFDVVWHRQEIQEMVRTGKQDAEDGQ